jgi:hypothetical protein
MADFEQLAAALAEAVELAEPLPEPLLPQAARLVPMATAAAAIMMRRMETVPNRPGERDRAR